MNLCWLPYLLPFRGFLPSIFWIIIGILNVAFLTIIERKLLSRIQRRIGPYRIFTQAILDGIKSITKERIFKESPFFYFFIFCNLFFTCLIWFLLPSNPSFLNFPLNFNIIFYLIFSAINFYPLIFMGLSSNNLFSWLAIIRGINSLISYEVNLSIIIIGFILILHSFNFEDYFYLQIDFPNYFYFPLLFLFFISLLAESNRIPFDLLEAESELVSGRVTEYSSLEFTIIYIIEYFMILINSYILIILFIGDFLFFPFIILLNLLSRAVLPRYTYNQILLLNWKEFLPLSFSFFLFFLLAG